MPQSTDPAGARLAEIRKNWDVFGDGDATPALLAAVEAVLELADDWAQLPYADVARGEAATQLHQAISRELLGEGSGDAR